MRNIVTLFLVGLVVLELFSFGATGFEGTYFPEVDNPEQADQLVLVATIVGGMEQDE